MAQRKQFSGIRDSAENQKKLLLNSEMDFQRFGGAKK